MLVRLAVTMDAEQRRSIGLLWNCSSGWSDSDEIRQKVETILSNGGSPVEVRTVERGDDIQQKSGEIASSADVVVAAGGDGTLNAAASCAVSKQVALGVIPAGTLNHFARDLRIPIDPEDAAKALVNGHEIRVDAAAVNGRVFINNAVLGLFPNYRQAEDAIQRRTGRVSRVGKFVTTVAALWHVFWRLPHLSVSLVVDGQPHTLRTPFVLIGNNEHRMEGIGLGSRSRLDSGKLWLYALPACTRWQFARMLLGLIFGRAPRESVFQIYAAAELTINSKQRRVGVGIDGEMEHMKPPLHFKSLPLALRVIAPAEYRALEAAEK